MINTTNALGPVEFYTINGTFPTSSAFSSYYPYPSTWTDMNRIVLISFEWYRSEDTSYRIGNGVATDSFIRYFCEREADGVRVYTNNAATYGDPFRIVLAYLWGQ